MSKAWELPTSLNVGGVDYRIRTDYRAILDVLSYFVDEEYEQDEKVLICLDIVYECGVEQLPSDYIEEAYKKAVEFIDAGITEEKNVKKPSVMDWEQDAPLIIPAINRVVGREIRALEYMHWWTFIGAYMEIGECLFSQIVSVRTKKTKGKKLEKYEEDFWKENKDLCVLKRHESQSEKDDKNALRRMLGFKER